MTASQDIQKFAKAITDSIKATTKEKQMRRLGNILIKVIQRRTRRGFGVKTELGNRRRLKRLSKNYIKKRKKSRLSRFTSARKSNLTFTGQMLSSLKLKKIRSGFSIAPNGSRTGSKLSNQNVADFVSVKRPFLNISKVEFRSIVQNFDDTLADVIKKSLSGL